MHLPRIFGVLKTAANNWIDDYAPSMGAALSYYTVFSMSPLLIIVIAIAAFIFGEHAAQSELMNQIRMLLGDQGAKAIEMMLQNAQKPKTGAIASVISVITLIIGATGVFNELESDLNRVFKTQAPEGSGIWHLLRTRLLSFGMVLAIGDHRGNSLDGRYWGLLDERELYGRAIAIYYRSSDVELRWSSPLQSVKALLDGFVWKPL